MMERGAPGWSRSVTPRKSRFRVLKVVGGVVVLGFGAAVLFPVFAQVRGSHRISTLSNIKQLGIGALIYANDFDDDLPVSSRWMDLTLPYTKSEALFHAFDLPDPSPDKYGIAFRASLGGRSAVRIKSPENTALIFDSTLMVRNASSEMWSLPNPGRHHDRNAIAFADGHVKMLSPEASQNLR